jgi:hypothetical protein
MASILDRYGIKEVADVTFYKINSDGTPGEPVLFLDTLKVSTIEQTAETVDARGGKGNPKLITWDYGKEITVNIEDALFSPKSMAIMLGDGSVNKATAQDINRVAVIRLDDEGKLPEYFTADIYDADMGSARKKVYIGSSTAPTGMVAFANSGITLKTAVSETGAVLDSTLTIAELQSAHSSAVAPYSSHAGEKVFITYSVKATTKTITISGDSFPGTYYVTGDTYSRSDVDGSDQFFQFIIPKAKMTAENTITLEAEGDPSTFSMNLTVLRPESGEMMKLVQYDLDPVSAG